MMNEEQRRPQLSICIPTYNGGRRIESALLALAPQVAALQQDVELIVSDNCSTDNTREVVERARQFGPIRYQRNEENVGQARNILKLTNELARGEFAWVLGDDDVVRPGCVERVLRVIREHPDIDYIFVNVAALDAAERNRLGRPVGPDDFPDPLPAKARDLSDHPVELWDDLVDPDVDDAFLGALMVSVVRLSRFRTYQPRIGPGNETWASLEHAYVLPTVLAHTMPGRKAFYIGYPSVLSFQGEQEWLGYYAVIVLVRLQELLDRYRKNGVAQSHVEKCRGSLLRLSADAFYELMRNRKHPGRKYFSLTRFIYQNRYQGRLIRHLLANVAREQGQKRLPGGFYRSLRATKRGLWHLLGREGSPRGHA